MTTKADSEKSFEDEWELVRHICDTINSGTQEDVIKLISETDFTGKKTAIDVAINAIELTPENINANSDILKKFVEQADFKAMNLGFKEKFRFGVLIEVLGIKV
ncbi:hypothetical protein DZF79_05090 [Vibrio parahaemolyticus]|nr:hypothetical protein [Vibrio parahaemolyticus]